MLTAYHWTPPCKLKPSTNLPSWMALYLVSQRCTSAQCNNTKLQSHHFSNQSSTSGRIPSFLCQLTQSSSTNHTPTQIRRCHADHNRSIYQPHPSIQQGQHLQILGLPNDGPLGRRPCKTYTCYRVCKSTQTGSGDSSAYRQQCNIGVQSNVNFEPRRQFLVNRIAELQKQQSHE